MISFIFQLSLWILCSVLLFFFFGGFCFDFPKFTFFFATVGWNALHLPGVWTATWTPRQFLKDGKPSETGNRTYMPMDIDIYGAAASYLESKNVYRFECQRSG